MPSLSPPKNVNIVVVKYWKVLGSVCIAVDYKNFGGD